MKKANRAPRVLAVLLFLFATLSYPSDTTARGVKFQVTKGGFTIEGVDSTCPMIYDNDWWFDTPDKNYLWAKASLGAADLRGNIVTRDMWDWQKGYLYKLEQGMKDARKSIAIARRSGLKNVPDPVPGCDRVFERPKSGKIEDTNIVRNPGSHLIVAEARKATPHKPLLVFVGGPLNTVANAYLSDPSIADRMIVFMTDLRGYNGKDPWANYIVATRCKLVNYGAHIWWPQRPDPPVMPLERFKELPRNEMTDDIQRIARWFWERSTKKDHPTRDDGFGDGAGIFLVFNPRTWLAVQRQKVTGVFGLRDVPGGPYDVLDARKLDYRLMTEDFFSTLKNPALYGKRGNPAAEAQHPNATDIVAFPLKISDNRPHLVDQNGVNSTYTYSPNIPSVGRPQFHVYAASLRDYNRTPVKPSILLESAYENERNSRPQWIRRQAYWSVLSGCTGHCIGNLPIYNFDPGWLRAMEQSASRDISHLKKLFDAVAWHKLVPDQQHKLVVGGFGTFDGQANKNEKDRVGFDYVTGGLAEDGSLAMAYLPNARTITVNLGKLSGRVEATWFDPTSGEYVKTPGSPFDNSGKRTLTPPSHNKGGDSDFILMLEVLRK